MGLRLVIGLAAFLLFSGQTMAGEAYRITTTDANETMTYEVKFGEGKLFGQYTGFCAKRKTFVYRQWKRSENAPEPVAEIWDHQTGRMIELYEFPNCPDPIPIIKSIHELKVCPFTGDGNFQKKLIYLYD